MNKKYILAGLLMAAAATSKNLHSVTCDRSDIYNKLVAVIKKEVIGNVLICCESPFCEYPAKFFYYVANKVWVGRSNSIIKDFAKKNGCSTCKECDCPTKKLLHDHRKHKPGLFSFGARHFDNYYKLKETLDKNIKNGFYVKPANKKE